MLQEIALAFIQAATEFLPISSSGHLALFSNIFSEPNLFFFTVLHLASLTAILIFTRKEIKLLLSFNNKALKIWAYLIIGTIPSAVFGYFFLDLIKSTFSSYLFLGIAFLFTGIILLLTKFTKEDNLLNKKNSLAIGLAQVLALFPGISRSGITISVGEFLGMNREQAAKFSFLLFIPLAIGAFILETGEAYFSISLLVSFFVTLIFSLLFLNLLLEVVKKGKFWLFSFYCFAVGLISLGLEFF